MNKLRHFILGMRLSSRLSIMVAFTVGIALAGASIVSYVDVSNKLYAQVDKTLEQARASIVSTGGQPAAENAIVSTLQTNDVAAQEINGATGAVSPVTFNGTPLPVNKTDLGIAKNNSGTYLHNVTSGDDTYRVLTAGGYFNQYEQPVAIQLFQSLHPVQDTLGDLRLFFLLLVIGGSALGVVISQLISVAALRPINRLTQAAEHVAKTQDLDSSIEVIGTDEVSRLASAFNSMLSALEESRSQQVQFVSDAGHELRTPLTGLRTNIELLLSSTDNMSEGDRSALQEDVTAQLEELGVLVGDLVELARFDEVKTEPTEVRLDYLINKAIERAKRRVPNINFDIDLKAGSVLAQPVLLERAVLNVLDNATKWSPPAGTVKVSLKRTDRLDQVGFWSLEISDQGPGIAESDLPHVFDRFYRADTARSMSGSGLGLAIVAQVIKEHNGKVHIDSEVGHGTKVVIELPAVWELEPSSEETL